MRLFRVLDPFTLTLICTVLLASFLPAEGSVYTFFEGLTTAAIALLFFMHGAKLSREAIIAGGGHWRLHLCTERAPHQLTDDSLTHSPVTPV